MTNRNAYIVRLVRQDDIYAYFRLIRNNQLRLTECFSEMLALTTTWMATSVYVTNSIQEAERNNQFLFVIEDILTNEMIGSIQVKMTDGSRRRAKIGYYIDAGFEGKGIAGRAVGEVVDFCFSAAKLNKLLVSMNEKNRRGRKVAEKNGFFLECILKDCHMATSGVTVDLVQYGLVNPGMQ